jgi:hypothetical protein
MLEALVLPRASKNALAATTGRDDSSVCVSLFSKLLNELRPVQRTLYTSEIFLKYLYFPR